MLLGEANILTSSSLIQKSIWACCLVFDCQGGTPGSLAVKTHSTQPCPASKVHLNVREFQCLLQGKQEKMTHSFGDSFESACPVNDNNALVFFSSQELGPLLSPQHGPNFAPPMLEASCVTRASLFFSSHVWGERPPETPSWLCFRLHNNGSTLLNTTRAGGIEVKWLT